MFFPHFSEIPLLFVNYKTRCQRFVIVLALKTQKKQDLHKKGKLRAASYIYRLIQQRQL